LWWYVDGISECRRYGVTVIAFVGSVFSPYYHFAGRKNPENHVCINVALYSVEGHRWAMTERGSGALKRNQEMFLVGPSSLRWEHDELVIDFAEMSLPWPPAQWWPKPISGRVRLRPRIMNEREFMLDKGGKHHWRPVAPSAAICVESDHFREGGWRGEGYFDTNQGSEPLEEGFNRWDWARGMDSKGNGIILYDAVEKHGETKRLGLRFKQYGRLEEFPLAPSQPLKRGFWGVKRHVPCAEDGVAMTHMALEDSPFYARSLVATMVDGEEITMMHETFDGKRLSNPVVRLMLSARMPRRAKWSR